MFSVGDVFFIYGEIVKDVIEWDFFEIFLLKFIEDFKYIGKVILCVDFYDKVVGSFIFGIDVELFDMFYVFVVCLDWVDVILKSCDSMEVEKMLGVIKVVKEDDFIGVIVELYF